MSWIFLQFTQFDFLDVIFMPLANTFKYNRLKRRMIVSLISLLALACTVKNMSIPWSYIFKAAKIGYNALRSLWPTIFKIVPKFDIKSPDTISKPIQFTQSIVNLRTLIVNRQICNLPFCKQFNLTFVRPHTCNTWFDKIYLFSNTKRQILCR